MRTQDSDSSAGELALRRGISAARAGVHSVATMSFERAAENLPDHPQVWMWLAWVANSPGNTIRCLERVLELSPGHPAATAGLIWMRALANDAPAPVAVVTAPPVVQSPKPIAALKPIVTSQPIVASQETQARLSGDTDRNERAFGSRSDNTAEPKAAALRLIDLPVRTVAPREPVVAPVEIVAQPNAVAAVTSPIVIPSLTAPEVQVPDPVPAPEIMAKSVRDTTNERHDEPAPPELAPPELAPPEPERRRWNELVQREPEIQTEAITVAPAALMPPPLPVIPPPLPVIPAAPEVAVQTRFNDVPASHESETTADVEALANSFSPPTIVASSDDRPLVMVVDDSPTVRKLVSLTLERRGYRVITAFDGVAAIKELGTCRPDLILLDINMPRLDGYRLCKLIKKHEATQNIPVVMLSGKDGMFDKLRGRLVGCADYITKPFEADALTHKVAKYLTPVASSL